MSEENVEVVRRIHEAAGRVGFMGYEVYRSHEGLRSFFREWSLALAWTALRR